MGSRPARGSGNQVRIRRIILHLPTISYLIFIVIYPYFSPVSVGKGSPWDKVWHFSVYFILVFLLSHSLQKVEGKPAFPGIFLIGIPWAFVDEFPQKFASFRKFEVKDLAMDISGILVGSFIIYMVGKRRERHGRKV